MEDNMKEIKKTVYVTDDGKEFTNRKEAELHETKTKDVKYFLVSYAPDLTEGRGLQNKGILMVHSKGCQSMFAEHYCYQKFGNKIEFVMGVYGSNAITQNWSIREINKEQTANYPVLARLEENFVTKIWGDEHV
jgi:hypothetical protein